MSRLLRGYVAVFAAAGLAAVVIAAVGTDGWPERPWLFGGFVVAIGTMARFQIYLLRGDEAEGLDLGETFLVAMALTLPPSEVVLAYGIGMAAGNLARRAQPIKVVFNIGQQLAGAGAAMLLFHALTRSDAGLPQQAAAAVAGVLVFFVVNSAAVAGVIAIVERMPFSKALADVSWVRLLVTLSNISLGLLMGIAGSHEQWAVPLAAAPVVMLHIAFRGHLLANQANKRLDGLFKTAVTAHASIGTGDVVDAVIAATADMLQCNEVRFDEHPPGDGEIAASVAVPGRPDRWLVAAGKRGIEGFTDGDRDLLEATTAIAAAALANADLYEREGRERKKLADVLTSSSDGIFSVDDDQRIQSWNPAMERITGFAAADMVGSRCFTAFRPRGADGTELCMGSCPGRCGREGVPVEMQVTTLGGGQRWLMSTYSPLPEGGYVVVARDVTAEREIEELKADFLATVSHELRTPLTPIKGFLQTLIAAEGALSDEMRQDIYEVMLKQSVRLERLVADLLDATSLDENSLFLIEELQWPDAAAEVVSLFERENPDRQFILDLGDGVPPVAADEQRAEQVLSNLLANAVKYSPEGSAVRVTITATDSHVVTTVSDGGPGIPTEHRDAVFERFRRLGNYMVRTSGGVGLGLYIGRRLVEAMGGSIEIGEAPEGGAAVTFTLPLAPRHASVSS